MNKLKIKMTAMRFTKIPALIVLSAIVCASNVSAVSMTGLHVVNGTGGASGHIVNSSGQIVQLHGADRAGGEWTCLYAASLNDHTDQTSLDAMKAWGINAIRVPLNEDCWLGINGVMITSAAYQSAVSNYVNLITSNGMAAIVDLHWGAPGTIQANGQLGMVDADHAPTFWTQAATTFAGNSSVIFDLFNEPFITDWNCWLVGGACTKDYSGNTFTAAGMATLLQAVRKTGAQNVVIIGGLGYSSDFSQWVAKVNSIPTLAAPLNGISLANVAASWHTYSDQSTQTLCPTQYNNYNASLTCASGAVTAANYGVPAVLAAGYPVVVGEIGIGAYSHTISPYTPQQAQYLATWLESMLTWVDQQGQGYLGWEWNTVAPPLLISDFTGKPTPYLGATYQYHLANLTGITLPVSVDVVPSSSAVILGDSLSFACTIYGSLNPACTWSVQEGAAGGTITGAGVYTAPLTAGTYHVVATSQADPTKSAAVPIIVAPASSACSGLIYNGTTRTGWADWSWGFTDNFSNASPVYPGATASVSGIYAAQYNGFSLHAGSNPVSLVSCGSFTFEVYPTRAGAQLAVVLKNGGASVTLNVANYVPGGVLTQNAWNYVSIPESAYDSVLGIAADTFAIQELTAPSSAYTYPSTFYFDAIQFFGGAQSGKTPARPHGFRTIP